MKINKQVLFIVSFIFICHLIDKILNKDIVEGFEGDFYSNFYMFFGFSGTNPNPEKTIRILKNKSES